VLLLFGAFVADFYSSLLVSWLTGATILILPTLVMFQKPDAQVLLPSASASVFATLYVATGACAMIGLRAYSWQAVLFVLVVVWAGDSAAYYAGRKFGKKKLAPVVSPKKTWEGFWGQLAGGMLLGGLYVAVIPRTVSEGSSLGNIALAVGIALALSVVAVIGDLVESTFKRSSGVKDSGGLLPGHGGLLDRLDSLLYSAPFVLLLVTGTQMNKKRALMGATIRRLGPLGRGRLRDRAMAAGSSLPAAAREPRSSRCRNLRRERHRRGLRASSIARTPTWTSCWAGSWARWASSPPTKP
jgi:CDP-diglyceride synthetase